MSEVAGESVGVDSEGGAVEMVGWLELPLDDAPRLVVAGLDEGSASAALAGGLLSPPLRRSLGLQDAETFHARDLYYLELLLASRDTTLVTGRRGAQGEPLSPRRILLAGATPELVDTVLTFWGEPETGREGEDDAPDAVESAFGPILPSPDVRIPERLPATAFRDYLACPYRFYLRHVLGLRQVRDLPRELPPGDFGRLLHAVLGRFARSPAASSDDPEVIARTLGELLEEESALRSGGMPRVAVRLQLEQLRRRLRSFAAWQAAQRRAGWTIDQELVEVRVEATLDIDGSRFVVTGRIDRVDRHPTLGSRLLDYKSAEQSVTPEQAHRAGRRGERRWTDLQLPLYERDAAPAGCRRSAGRRRARARLRQPRASPERGPSRARRVERGRSRRCSGDGAQRGAVDSRACVLAAGRSAVVLRRVRGPGRRRLPRPRSLPERRPMTDIATTGEGDRSPQQEAPLTVDPAAVAQPHHVVRASAGSGKTHRLALRYLEILFAGGKPDTIVAATFTREAAGEILGRVLTRLAAAAGDAGEARRLGGELGRPDLQRRHAERALRSVCTMLDRVVVATLDSFFFRLTAALRLELGLAGVPAVAALDDPLLRAVREEALEATLASLADDDWRELVDLFERLGGAGARRSVARSLDQLLLELYEIYLEAPQRELWGRMQIALGPEAGALAVAIAALESVLRASAPGALRKALAGDLESARHGAWDRLLDRGLVGKLAGEPTAMRFGSAIIPPAWRESLLVLVEHARRQVLATEVARTQATHHLLDAFHQQYWRLRRRRGVLLFSDLAAGIERWLDAAPDGALDELYYRIDERVGHLLLDEFQDTSLAQWSVLRPIAEEIRAWGDGSRTFFCVGDPKQAIYGWRGGCADLFDQIEEDLALDPASGERLDESFRSSQIVLDAVNLVFGRLGTVPALTEHAETVERWSAAFGAHRSRTASAGYAELVESPRDQDHVEWSAGRLRELAAAMPEASIAVLVQTNDQAAAMLDALRRLGVEASGEGTGAVADDPAVAAVIAALILADHPGDTIAAFHVAGSPLGALIGVRSRESSETLAASRRLRQDLAERGAAVVLAGWRRALAVKAGERGRMRLAQAVDLAERFEREGGGRPGELASYLSSAVVESPRQAGIRVMTIHRAKGLEFDIVVLPALDRELLRPPHAPVYLLRRSPLAPVDAVHRSVAAAVRRLAPELEDGHQQERARRLRDDLSVLYVALTRARQGLHLWIESSSDAAGERDGARETLSFAAILRATLTGRLEEAAAAAAPDDGGTSLYRAGDRAAVASSISSARLALKVARQGELPLSSGSRDREQPALRPAVSLDDLLPEGPVRGAAILTPASAHGDRLNDDWGAIEASLARCDEATPSAALAAAREWLFADGRSLERVDRCRRFAVVGGRKRRHRRAGPGLDRRRSRTGSHARWSASASAPAPKWSVASRPARSAWRTRR